MKCSWSLPVLVYSCRDWIGLIFWLSPLPNLETVLHNPTIQWRRQSRSKRAESVLSLRAWYCSRTVSLTHCWATIWLKQSGVYFKGHYIYLHDAECTLYMYYSWVKERRDMYLFNHCLINYLDPILIYIRVHVGVLDL